MIISSVDYVPPIRDAAAKAKGPADRLICLRDLPRDIHNLITPYLVDPQIESIARDRNVTNLSGTTKSILEAKLGRFFIDHCRDNIERIRLYREIALDEGEYLDDPANLGEISNFLTTYDTAVARNNTKKRIVKGQFTVTVTPSTFKYSIDAHAKLSPPSAGRIALYCDGFSAIRLAASKFISFFKPSKTTAHHPYLLYNSSIRDFTLAPAGILFVASDDYLRIYDLNQPLIAPYLNFELSGATMLHQLHYQFNKITWDEEKACLIGEKDGRVTELKFKPSVAKTPESIKAPVITKPLISLRAKITYAAQRILKIIVIEGPSKAFKRTVKDLRLHPLSNRVLVDSFGLGTLGVGLLITGLRIRAEAPPVFTILAVPATVIGGGLTFSAITPLILPPFFGIISGMRKAFSSLNRLRKEEIFH